MAPIEEWFREDFVISTDPVRLDRDFVWRVVVATYWGRNLSRKVFERSLDTALVFGLYEARGRQVGFARVVTDFIRFAWLSDVIIDESVRGRGLGCWLVEAVLDHGPLTGMQRWVLKTRDAQNFYQPFGFREIGEFDGFMIRER